MNVSSAEYFYFCFSKHFGWTGCIITVLVFYAPCCFELWNWVSVVHMQSIIFLSSRCYYMHQWTHLGVTFLSSLFPENTFAFSLFHAFSHYIAFWMVRYYYEWFPANLCKSMLIPFSWHNGLFYFFCICLTFCEGKLHLAALKKMLKKVWTGRTLYES